MAHYAFVNENNIVTEVIVGRNEDEIIDGIFNWESYYGELRGQRCLRTSYNNNIRGIYAGIGFSYNEEEDIFVTPQPYPSWIRNGSLWDAPVEYPTDGGTYNWNESTLSWNEVE
jgi:hypothetical protein